MQTLNDLVCHQLESAGMSRLADLSKLYGEDSHMAKSYSIFCFLVAMGYNCEQEKGEAFAELMESFFLATSIHDDIVDQADRKNESLSSFSINERIVLGDIYFIELSLRLAALTQLIDQQNRDRFLQYFKHEMLVVAKSQLKDQAMAYKTYTPEESLQQSADRGGSWGRAAMGSVAIACGVPEDEVNLLTDAANNIFVALTILDDLQDLEDDLQNGIYTLAPSYYAHTTGDTVLFKKGSFKKINQALIKSGALDYTLQTACDYADRASRELDEIIAEKEGMYWFQMKSFFSIIGQQLKRMKEHGALPST